MGATAGQAVSKKRTLGTATLVGMLAGMAPDLDVLIRSDTDPLLALEYHRQFTHSLIFIPLGALLCALFAHLTFARSKLEFWQTYLFCLAGYATHALLDACTTYGTMLLWPFSDMRVAWNTVSVVDPLFTIPALILVIAAVRFRSRLTTLAAILWMASYLLLGAVQNHRAYAVAEELALSRGHSPLNLGVKPSFANVIVWKSVYEHDGRYYVDAIRVLSDTTVFVGTSTAKLDVDQQFPWLTKATQQGQDIERFRWFSNDHLGVDPSNHNRIIDIRYSLVPNELTGMWGITLSPDAMSSEHAAYTTNRPGPGEARQKVALLWSMIRNRTSSE